jgi:cobalt/nickel transport system permease protein
MHIPDGFLATPVWLSLDAAALPAVGYLASRAQREFEDTRVPLLGVMGAFVFAAQMINFPVGVGTSGHLVGSALLAVTLGPAAAAIVMTAILAIQALVFQDGGILALGANVLNMAVAGVLAGYLPYHLLASRARRAGIFAGAVLSVYCGAMLAILELRLSGVPMPQPVVTLAATVFAVTALIEGAITVAVVGAIERLSPRMAARRPSANRRVLAALALVAVVLATVGALFASAWPDGLEAVAERTGIAHHARNLVETPLADYGGASRAGKALAGAAGVALVAGALIAVQRLMARRGSA